MTAYGVRIGVGTRFSYDGEVVEIIEVLTTPAGNELVFKVVRDQSIRRMALRELLNSRNAQVIPDGPGPGADDDVETAGVVLAQLSDVERAEIAARAEHVREMLTGYKSGHSEMPQPGEPRPEFDPHLPMEAKYAAKSAELAVTDRTIKRWVRAYRQLGVAGLANETADQPTRTDGRWIETALEVMVEHTDQSRPSQTMVIDRTNARVAARFGDGVVKCRSRATNMNANEVIANRANQLLGQPLGTKHPVHPNDHVNKGQSSNDVTPTVIHLAAQIAITHTLLPALGQLRDALSAKAIEHHDVIKTGRTHLQDAVPIRLGQELRGHAGQLQRGLDRIRASQSGLAEVALGGTAVGTGINTHPEFAARVTGQLAAEFGIELWETENHFQAQNSLDAVVFTSGALKTVAVSLLKIANDIRWMGSGPRAGLGEIEMPHRSMGSSIMPGKTNPIIAEAVCQVAAKVIGNDATITIAGQHGNFEINVMMPVVAYTLLESIQLLASAATVFADRCINGITATTAGPEAVERGLMMATALSPRIGYDAAAGIARHARETGSTIREVAREHTDLSEDTLTHLLDARLLAGP